MTFRPDRRFWVIYVCLMMVMFLTAMYHTVVATALPVIIGDLGGVSRMSWAITFYTIAQTLAMPVTGKLGDVIVDIVVDILGWAALRFCWFSLLRTVFST